MLTHETLPGAEGAEWRRAVRSSLLVMAGLTSVISLMLAGYSSGLGKPTPRNIPIAVRASGTVQRALDASPALRVDPVTSYAAARAHVIDRRDYGALVVTAPRAATLLVAGGGGHSVDVALTAIMQAYAERSGLQLTTLDLAPLGANDPNGTLEFYAVVFLAVGGALGATMLGRVLGAVRSVRHLARRVIALALLSGLLAGASSTLLDAGFGAVTGHSLALFLALWGYTLAICLACSGVSATFGSFAGLALTLIFTILGNTSSGGAVGRPLLPPFFAALTPVIPHGAGMSVVRGVQYFGDRGIASSVLCLACWGGGGLVLHLLFAIRRARLSAPVDGPERGRVAPRPA